MAQFRFIRTHTNYADFSTSTSPAIELALGRMESKDTVILNVFNGDSFTVGFFDDPEKSMDLEFCRKKNIIVRRRQNAGGAVLGADGCAFLVIYVNTGNSWVPMKTIQGAFVTALSGLADVIREQYDIEAEYRPLNDVEVNGKKLVASSARLENNMLTVRLLINVVPTDTNVLTKAIKVPVEKIQDKQIKDVGERFTCLETEAGRSVSDSDLLEITQKSVEKIFGETTALIPGDLSGIEKEYAEEFQKKYTSKEWFFENSEQIRFRGAPADALKTEGRHKALAGLIRTTLLFHHNRIYDLIVTGDFHPTPNTILRDMENTLRGRPRDLKIVEKEIKQIFERPDVEIAGTGPDDFLKAFEKAFNDT